ncbi:hypothetical protein [Flavobacterium gyeonganense]|uniref:Uncharacterized protein n=1 Tax=Flavobacterium gyeonganense TaxID=1310418 RepID=A0ABV5H8H3_9FLAO|nr:hypothetical protein [Flavobacterium gyeonganense]
MDLNLLTIARRAGLSSIIEMSFNDANTKILQIKNINDKINNSHEFTNQERSQNCDFTIIGLVSIFEHQINEILRQILISYPKKFGTKKFEIDELLEEGSILELFHKKANQKILDLAYGKFDGFIKSFSDTLELSSPLNAELINEINEIKCTRDCIIHSQGKATNLYFSKTGSSARRNDNKNRLTVDYIYVENAIVKIKQLLNDIHERMPDKYKSSNRSYVFKQMWEATCLNERVKFDTVWTIESPSMIRPVDIERSFGFSSSEMEVYNLFRYIYSGFGSGLYKVDFSFYFSRWKPKSNEYQIAVSWLDYQFYF